MPATGSTSTPGRLRAALAKASCTAAPSMISTDPSPSFEKRDLSSLVLASFSSHLSITTSVSDFALAESACLSASARTFFGNAMAWLRGFGPKALPPPRNRGALPLPSGALLPVKLGPGVIDLGTILHRARAAAPLGELVAHHAMEDIGARLEPEHIVRQLNRSRLLGVERGDVGLHYSWLPASAWTGSASGAAVAGPFAASPGHLRKAPGFG